MYWGEHVLGWLRDEPFAKVTGHERRRLAWKKVVSDTRTLAVYWTHWYLPSTGGKVREVGIEAGPTPSKGTPALLAVTAVYEQTFVVDGRVWGYRDFNFLNEGIQVAYDEGSGAMNVPYHGDNHHSQLAFCRAPVQGEFTFTARMESFDFGGEWNFLGLSAREQPLHYGHLGGTNHVTLNFRTSGEAQLTDGHSVGGVQGSLRAEAPVWMRLEQTGSRFAGYVSSSGLDGSWQKVAEVSKGMYDELYLGFNCSAAHTYAVNTAVFGGIALEGSFSPTAVEERYGRVPRGFSSHARPDRRPTPTRLLDLRGRCMPAQRSPFLWTVPGWYLLRIGRGEARQGIQLPAAGR
jgi:hypothetical protein